MKQATLATLCWLLVLSGCQGPDDDTATTGESVATDIETVLAELISQGFVASAPPRELTEPYAFTLFTENGLEVVNTFNYTGVANQLIYSCDRNEGPFSTFFVPLADSNHSGDTSGMGKGQFGTNWRAYISALGGNGIRYYRTMEPCPTSGAPTWTVGNIAPPITINGATIDYPHAFYDEATDQGWITFTAQLLFTGQTTIGVLRLNATGDGGTYHMNTCDFNTNQFSNGAVDANGDPLIVYKNQTTGFVRTVRFNRSTNTFDCSASGNMNVGPHAYQAANCAGTCGATPTLALVGTGCLRDTFNPSIAIDLASFPANFVVTYHSAGSGMCANQGETRFYRKVAGAPGWTWAAVTGCQTSVQPRVTATRTVGWGSAPNVFDVATRYSVGGSNMRTVIWRSADAGASWVGTFASTSHSVTNFPGGCYWGDYIGIASDMAHNSVYMNWWAPAVTGFRAIQALSVTP